jgi:hypothetical protein
MTSSMPKGHRRLAVRWWRSLEPFDQLVMVCAILAVPAVLAYCLLGAAIYVLYWWVALL